MEFIGIEKLILYLINSFVVTFKDKEVLNVPVCAS